MLPTGHLLAFSLISFVLIVVPGPNVLFVVSRSLQLGRVAGVATAAGGQLGVFGQVVLVAFGLGTLVERSVTIFSVIKLAGAAYLIYLGVQAVRHRRSDGTWAVAAGSARAWLGRSPRRLELIGGTGVLAMIGIGASLAITGRKD
jgi:threonine/homoserine/homoserine lactone efflux protein